MSDAAPWLKAMENGGLGEARARAFLMERFWVLERSVDVEGADYLIQRRLTATNFLDHDPPRLGVVQVKFIQDGGTYIRVHKAYAVDRRGAPYNEFFLIVFTGREDEERSFLLSSGDMIREFEEIDDGGTAILRLQGAKLIAGSNYEITRRALALDRIEHALKNADFFSNRRFIGSTRYVDLSSDQIDHDLTIPLDNEWGDVPKEFFKGKKKIQSTLYDMEEITEALSKILGATDPMEALRIYEEDVEDHVRRGGFGGEISVRCEFFDEDLFTVVKNHRARLAKIRELGIEGNYLKLIETLKVTVLKEVANLSADPNLKAVEISVTYDPESLSGGTVRVSAGSITGTEPEILVSRKGAQTFVVGVPVELQSAVSAEREAILKKWLWRFHRPFQRALERVYLGDDLVAW
jgi:hypothetical protein